MKISTLKKLYKPFILLGTICSYFYFLATSDSRNIHTGVSFTLLVIGVVLMLIEILKENEKSYKEEMKRLRERHDSSSPRWDGVVRSDNDLEPRMRMLENKILKDTYELQLLENKILKDTYELQRIKLELKQHYD